MKPIGSVKKIYLKEIMTFEEAGKFEADFIPFYFFQEMAKKHKLKDWFIDEDCDGYIRKNGKDHLIFIFRKKLLPEELAIRAIDNLKDCAKRRKNNRGAYAGVLDRDRMPKYIGEYVHPSKFRTKYYSATSGKYTPHTVSNLSPSNIFGYFDRIDRNLKGVGAKLRKAAFLRDYPEKWNNALPYFQFLSNCYRDFFKDQPKPNHYSIQENDAKKIPEAMVKDTVFSTITCNYSSLSGTHLDKANKEGGVAVLNVIEDPYNLNTYDGSYLHCVQFGLCFNVRHCDVLIIDNRNVCHGNTEYIPKKTELFPIDSRKPKRMPTDIEVKNDWHYNRFSSVCYLRDSIIKFANKKRKLADIDTLGIS